MLAILFDTHDNRFHWNTESICGHIVITELWKTGSIILPLKDEGIRREGDVVDIEGAKYYRFT